MKKLQVLVLLCSLFFTATYGKTTTLLKNETATGNFSTENNEKYKNYGTILPDTFINKGEITSYGVIDFTNTTQITNTGTIFSFGDDGYPFSYLRFSSQDQLNSILDNGALGVGGTMSIPELSLKIEQFSSSRETEEKNRLTLRVYGHISTNTFTVTGEGNQLGLGAVPFDEIYLNERERSFLLSDKQTQFVTIRAKEANIFTRCNSNEIPFVSGSIQATESVRIGIDGKGSLRLAGGALRLGSAGQTLDNSGIISGNIEIGYGSNIPRESPVGAMIIHGGNWNMTGNLSLRNDGLFYLNKSGNASFTVDKDFSISGCKLNLETAGLKVQGNTYGDENSVINVKNSGKLILNKVNFNSGVISFDPPFDSRGTLGASVGGLIFSDKVDARITVGRNSIVTLGSTDIEQSKRELDSYLADNSLSWGNQITTALVIRTPQVISEKGGIKVDGSYIINDTNTGIAERNSVNFANNSVLIVDASGIGNNSVISGGNTATLTVDSSARVYIANGRAGDKIKLFSDFQNVNVNSDFWKNIQTTSPIEEVVPVPPQPSPETPVTPIPVRPVPETPSPAPTPSTPNKPVKPNPAPSLPQPDITIPSKPDKPETVIPSLPEINTGTENKKPDADNTDIIGNKPNTDTIIDTTENNKPYIEVIISQGVSAKSAFPKLSNETATLIDYLPKKGINTESIQFGIRFLSRSADNLYLGNKDKDLTARTIESASRVAVASGIVQFSKAIADSISVISLNRLENKNNIAEIKNKENLFSLWISPVYKHISLSGMIAGEMDYNFTGGFGGIFLGMDKEFTNTFKAGLGFGIGSGYSKSSGDFAKTENRMNFTSASVYAGYNKNNFGLNSNLSYIETYNKIEQDLPTELLMQNLKSDIKAKSVMAEIKAFYDFELEISDIQPHVGIKYINTHIESYTVKSGGHSVLKGNSSFVNIWEFPVGISFSKEWEYKNWKINPYLDISIIPSTGDTNIKNTVTYTEIDTSTTVKSQFKYSFLYQGTLGLEVKKNNFKFSLDYENTSGQKTNINSVFGKFIFEF